jgi:hypothetical protein
LTETYVNILEKGEAAAKKITKRVGRIDSKESSEEEKLEKITRSGI